MGVGLSRRGLHDWIAQRVTAVIIALYAVFLVSYLVSHHPVSFQEWQALFSSTVMKIATVIVVLSILWHAWIGLWTVFTDYVKNCSVRLILEILVIIALLSYLVWCIDVLWG